MTTHDEAHGHHSGQSTLYLAQDQAGIDPAVPRRRAHGLGERLVLIGRCGRDRPLAGFADILRALVEHCRSDAAHILARYHKLLATALPGVTIPHAGTKAPLFHAGLADFVLHGEGKALSEFFRKREIQQRVVGELVRFLIDASRHVEHTVGKQVTLCCINVERADALSLQALSILARYAPASGLDLWVAAVEPPASCLEQLGTGWPGWRHEEPVPGGVEVAEWLLERIADPAQRQVLAALALAVRPLSTADWIELCGWDDQTTLLASCKSWLDIGIVDGSEQHGWRIGSGFLEEHLTREIPTERRASLHRKLLTYAQASADPFAITHHARHAGELEQEYAAGLEAVLRSWGLGTYDVARTYAERVIALRHTLERDEFDDSLLRAMLAYEAGAHAETREHLLRLVEDKQAQRSRRSLVTSGEDDRALLAHLIGHNDIFGLGRHQDGFDRLSEVLEEYTRHGMSQHVAYVRNAMAFALFCTRPLDEVIEWEKSVLQDVQSVAQRDSFIESVLQLNLSRLHHSHGDIEQAIDYLHRVLQDGTAEQTPSLQLLYHSKLGYYHFLQGRYTDALREFTCSLELCSSVQLDHIDDSLRSNLGGLFRQQVTKLAAYTMLYGDQALLYLHYNLAATCMRMGLQRLGRLLSSYVVRSARACGCGGVERIELALEAAGSAAVTATAGEDRRFQEIVRTAIAGFGDILAIRDKPPAQELTAHLNQGGELVWVACPAGLAGTGALDALVLCDSRRAGGAPSDAAEVHRARACLVLPEAAELFVGPLAAVPYVQQMCSLLPEQYAQFPALEPVGMLARMIFEEWDGTLHEVLASFHRATGTPLLGVNPFYDLACEQGRMAELTLRRFLESPFELMRLADVWVIKCKGVDAVENLYPLMPRLSSHVRFFSTRDTSDSFYLSIEPRLRYRKARYLKINSRLRALLEQCDGQHTVAELLREHGDGNSAEAFCRFLRELRRQRALFFH